MAFVASCLSRLERLDPTARIAGCCLLLDFVEGALNAFLAHQLSCFNASIDGYVADDEVLANIQVWMAFSGLKMLVDVLFVLVAAKGMRERDIFLAWGWMSTVSRIYPLFVGSLCATTSGYQWDKVVHLPLQAAGVGAMAALHCLIQIRLRERPQQPATSSRLRTPPDLERFSRVVQEGEQLEECTICLDSMDAGSIVSTLPCGHYFHRACLESWLRHSDKCPLRCSLSGLPAGQRHPVAPPAEAVVDPSAAVSSEHVQEADSQVEDDEMWDIEVQKVYV